MVDWRRGDELVENANKAPRKIDGQRTTENEITDYMMTMRDTLLAHIARGDTIEDVVRILNKALEQRMLRIMRESAA